MESNFSDEDFLGSFNLAMPDENEYFEKLDKRRLDIDVIKMRDIVSTQETPESKVLTEIKSLKVSRDDVASRKNFFSIIMVVICLFYVAIITQNKKLSSPYMLFFLSKQTRTLFLFVDLENIYEQDVCKKIKRRKAIQNIISKKYCQFILPSSGKETKILILFKL